RHAERYGYGACLPGLRRFATDLERDDRSQAGRDCPLRRRRREPGGSGNFGIVTSFTFQLHPVGPMVVAGLVAHPMERAVEVLRFYRQFVETIPDEINTVAGILTPPDGVKVVVVATCHCVASRRGSRRCGTCGSSVHPSSMRS